MGKLCSTAVGVGVAGALVGMYVYAFMTPREQRHVQRGLKNAVDDLKDVTDKLTEVL